MSPAKRDPDNPPCPSPKEGTVQAAEELLAAHEDLHLKAPSLHNNPLVLKIRLSQCHREEHRSEQPDISVPLSLCPLGPFCDKPLGYKTIEMH